MPALGGTYPASTARISAPLAPSILVLSVHNLTYSKMWAGKDFYEVEETELF